MLKSTPTHLFPKCGCSSATIQQTILLLFISPKRGIMHYNPLWKEPAIICTGLELQERKDEKHSYTPPSAIAF